MPRSRAISLVAAALVGAFVAACNATGPTLPPAFSAGPNPEPTAAATAVPTGEPTAAPTATPTDAPPFEGQPYALDLPEGWVAFDLSDPAGSAALDQFVQANPQMAAAIEAFRALPNVTMAVNLLLANVLVAVPVPTNGQSLDVIAAAFTTQFAAVPGVVEAPVPEPLTLPVGPVVHWQLTIQANDPNGQTFQVGESVYLAANETTAVLVEFVEVGGAGIPQEQQIIQTLRFTP